jgi:hypothetical protein
MTQQLATRWRLPIGDVMTLAALPDDVVQTSGNRYAVVVDPATVPDANVAEDGLVTFRVEAVRAGLAADPVLRGESMISVRRVATHEGWAWVDPLEPRESAPPRLPPRSPAGSPSGPPRPL